MSLGGTKPSEDVTHDNLEHKRVIEVVSYPADVKSRSYSLYQLRVRSDYPLSAESNDSLENDLEFARAGSNDECPFVPSDVTLRYKNSATQVEIHEWNSIYCLSYTNIANFFVLNPSQVICHSKSGTSDALIVALFQGPVCAVVLELRGFACLHASAVVIGQLGVGFMGHSGAGKSSLAMQFVSRGCSLITDDILALSFDANVCRALPGPAQIKLRPDMEPEQGRELPMDRRFEPSLQKHLHDLHDAAASHRSVPLGVVYVMQRESWCRSAPIIESLAPSECFIELLRFSFCARVIGTLGLETTRFRQLGRIGESVTMKRLRYANGRDNFAIAHQAILADCGVE